MPYIKQIERPAVDTLVDSLVHYVGSLEDKQQDGTLNYTITTLVNRVLKPKRYYDFQRVMGLLECVKQEFYRAMVGPYEDIKKGENGDVYQQKV